MSQPKPPSDGSLRAEKAAKDKIDAEAWRLAVLERMYEEESWLRPQVLEELLRIDPLWEEKHYMKKLKR